jgi:hypothetical protein
MHTHTRHHVPVHCGVCRVYRFEYHAGFRHSSTSCNCLIVRCYPVITTSNPNEVKSFLVSWLSLTQLQNLLLFMETSYTLTLILRFFRYVTPCGLSHICQCIRRICYYPLHDRRFSPRSKWPEISVRNCHYTLRNSPEQPSSLLY